MTNATHIDVPSKVAMMRDSFDLLLQEAYDGPPDPDASWIVTSARDTGVLGTIRHLTASQAWYRPEGISHSVAEQVAHILFSLEHAQRCAVKHERLTTDWDQSWNAGDPDEGHWQSMQRHLQESHLRLRMWVHADETFESKHSISLLIATIAHAAYHLGAMRQVAALATKFAPAADPLEVRSRPL